MVIDKPSQDRRDAPAKPVAPGPIGPQDESRLRDADPAPPKPDNSKGPPPFPL